jgi:transcriptional regulator with XRE-family HTH domain
MQDIAGLVATRVRSLRTEQRMTIEQLAQRSGLSPEMISRIERRRVVPSIRTMERAARGLGVPLTALLIEEPVAEASAEGIPPDVRGLALLLTGRSARLIATARRIVEALIEGE